MTTQRTAPVYLNLFRIRFPVAAVTSIAHRISGVLLFLALPFLTYLLDISLQDPAGYAQAGAILANPWLRLGSAIIAWSLFHHLLSGIRYLLIDVEKGVSLTRARATAWSVNLAALALTLAWLWWIF
ncbi:MAG: succinate dehydrogenase, cytochrome b556 subunit [Gammaproteobacteria bacterium]